MKKYNAHLCLRLLVTLAFFFSSSLNAQTTLHTSGKNLLDICGNTIILRGVDYAPYNWGNDLSDATAEIEKTGANCIRLAWYVNGGGAPNYTTDNLDTILTRCAREHMIPIIELHDQTCNDNSAALTTLAQWFTQTDVANVLQKHKAYLIANIANEALYHNWSADPPTAVTTYINTYSGIIGSIRAAGMDFPLMIDAPDCGTDITLFSTVASTLNTSDPKHNLIFSSHAYWYSYASNDSAQMAALIAAASALNYPVVLGEFGNYQDDVNPCQYVLNYTALLHICETHNFPWICWSWDHDNCTARQMSTNGQFNSLSVYGNDVVNNTGYGLKAKAVRSSYLVNNNSCTNTGIQEEQQVQETLNSFQTQKGSLNLQSKTGLVQQVMVTDILGRKMWQGNLLPYETNSVALPAGLYLITCNRQTSLKKVVE